MTQHSKEPSAAFGEEAVLRAQLEKWLSLPFIQGRGPALLCVDCDRFKSLCEDLSPGLRERVVSQVADRLTRHTGRGDSLARTGSDRFLLGLAPLDQPEDALRVAGAIVQEFSTPVSVGKIDVHLSVSVGIAIFPRDGIDPGALCSAALSATWEAKRQGGNAYAQPAESA